MFHISSSSSSSEDDDAYNTQIITSLQNNRHMICRAIHNNNMIIQQRFSQQNQQPIHGGSVPGHVYINRDREAADRRLYNDYFADNLLYNEAMFRRRYRMSRSLFLRIVEKVKDHDNYFQRRAEHVGRLGLSLLQKITAVFRILAYGVLTDATDEYVKIGESNAIGSLKKFCRVIVEIFMEEYLRTPTTSDIARLLHIGKQRGLPEMLGSLDCMHGKWKNCPTAWAGQYAGRSGTPTIILEAVADYDLWIWHAYFGLPGTIVQTIHEPQGRKKKYFALKQESCRKDVERAFGVLQSRFAIVARSIRYWSKEVLHDIMTTCIILHNMIAEDERDFSAPIEDAIETPPPNIEVVIDENV